MIKCADPSGCVSGLQLVIKRTQQIIINPMGKESARKIDSSFPSDLLKEGTKYS